MFLSTLQNLYLKFVLTLSAPLLIPLRVHAPMYLRWWFLSILAVLGAALVWAYLQAKIRNLTLQNLRLEEKVAEKIQLIQEKQSQLEEDKRIIEAQAAALQQLDEAKAHFLVDDATWRQELDQTIEKNLSNFGYGVELLAEQMKMSRQHLNKRIKTLTGLTAVQYLQEARLDFACQLLETRKRKSVKQVALEVGFKDVKYFSQLFKNRFGRNPSEV